MSYILFFQLWDFIQGEMIPGKENKLKFDAKNTFKQIITLANENLEKLF